MNLKLASFVIALLICLQFTTQQEISKRAPGDLIWTQCGNVSRTILTQNIQIDNVCVTLTEANNCGVMVRVTVANQQILNERFDTNVGATVCGTTGVAPGVSCSVCSSFRDSPPSQQCVFLQPNCTVANVPTGFWPPTRLGCFPNEKLAFMQQCQQNDCPGSCSGHGTCYGGECNCNDGWFGNDCSINTQLFEKCQRIDQFAGTVCVRLIFKQNCEIALQTVVESGPLELYKQEQSYSIKNFNSVFQQQKCYDTPGCQLCLKWDELELTKTNAHGCGTLSVVCGGLTVGSYSLGCFDDDQVVPACFGSCINDCSGHGSCDQGICTCDSGHEGDDCSIEIKCPNNCGGKEQGTCTKGVCSCKSGYSGDDCSKKDVQSSSFKPAYVIVPIILVAGVGVFGFTIYFVKKRNSSEQPRFHRFDLMEEETKDSAELQGSVE